MQVDAPHRRSLFLRAAGEARAAATDGRKETRVAWPSTRYQRDPVAFAREVLGVEPHPKQVEILEAIRDHKRVTVRSGHKVGKSMTAAIAALWFFCSFDDARVIMSSTTSRQVDAILWREVRQLHTRAPKHIGGELHELARSGLKQDFREIVGFTAKEAEAVAGVSGKNLLYLIDEASGVPDAIFEAIEGNRAGGARIGLFSNPTRTEGKFFQSHCDPHAKKFWKQIHVSSADVVHLAIGGLAEQEWVDTMREEYGEQSPFYLVRVKGEFVLGEDGKIVTLHAITQAQARWLDQPFEGRLHLGVDPAGPGEFGDESVIAVRRGLKVQALFPYRGQTEDALVTHIVGTLKDWRATREAEIPIVKVDREGPIGSRLYGLLLAHLDRHANAFELVAVRSSDRACRKPREFDRVRDELWASLAEWMKEGGTIPEDDKLTKELHAPQWHGQLSGRLKCTDKRELKKQIGRSPDRADAVALAVWEPMASAPVAEKPEEQIEPPDAYAGGDIDQIFDPYRSVDRRWE